MARPGLKLRVVLFPFVALAVAATTTLGCGEAPVDHAAPSAPAIDAAEYPGLGSARFALLAAICTVDASGITVSVDAGETALIALNTTGNVSINAARWDGSAC